MVPEVANGSLSHATYCITRETPTPGVSRTRRNHRTVSSQPAAVIPVGPVEFTTVVRGATVGVEDQATPGSTAPIAMHKASPTSSARVRSAIAQPTTRPGCQLDHMAARDIP